ncbi:MAG TPA: DUF2530 domain-containing protein [Candidatus Paceibacterota bacterium]|nr:DUF2530 domain-containing protein [Candidatus Paceibacterota bacterium]
MAQYVRSVVKLLSFGISAWIVAGAIAIAINAESKVIWTCFIGALLGLTGMLYTIRRARRTGI